MTAGGDLVVGNNQVFPFEEVKRDPLRFSTNKVKRGIELENLKTGKEEPRLTGRGTLDAEVETAKVVVEKEDADAETKDERNKTFPSPLDEIRAEKCDVEKELSDLRVASKMREELEGEKKRLEELKINDF